MAADGQNRTDGVALVSAPWPLYNRPSIQLGALKAYLGQRFPAIRVETHHLYLTIAAAIGYDTYQAVSERTWLAEAIYAGLLYPERFNAVETFFRRKATRQNRLNEIDLSSFGRQIAQQTDRWFDKVQWDSFAIVGFSVSLCQFSSTLYLLRKIKHHHPDILCVVGGSSFSGIPPQSAFDLIDEIDVIISGEGELPLAHLVQSCLIDERSLKSIKPVNGLFSRHSTGGETEKEFNQISSLDQLPPPQYEEYFNTLSGLPPGRHFFPTLPFELSRGCWWQRRGKDGSSGCAFCNLNLQWAGYRQKSSEQAVAELDHLTSRHQILSIAFTDNILPVKPSDSFFKSLAGLNKDFRLFGEIRASTDRRTLQLMRAAGMNEVQIGIEALSTGLLQKLNKGTRAIENLAVMKHCEELGIKNVSNVILQFPGSDARDVAETLHTLKFARCFRPLKPVEFWLGMGSPLWQRPRRSGIRAVFNHRNWFHLFPESIARSFPFTVLGYRGDLVHQRRLWKPVRTALRSWEKDWLELNRGPDKGPILSYRDGRDFIVIRQRRPSSPTLTHRLTTMSASIYRMCLEPRSFKAICSGFSQLPDGKIRSFLKMMVDKRLMFEEDDRFLSLAFSENTKRMACDI